MRCYAEFFARRLRHHPASFADFVLGAASGRNRTKGEMVVGSLLRGLVGRLR